MRTSWSSVMAEQPVFTLLKMRARKNSFSHMKKNVAPFRKERTRNKERLSHYRKILLTSPSLLKDLHETFSSWAMVDFHIASLFILQICANIFPSRIGTLIFARS
jgi:hypothetical protein